jgi:hypothetical protein
VTAQHGDREVGTEQRDSHVGQARRVPSRAERGNAVPTASAAPASTGPAALYNRDAVIANTVEWILRREDRIVLDALMQASHDGPFAVNLRTLSPADTATVSAASIQRFAGD